VWTMSIRETTGIAKIVAQMISRKEVLEIKLLAVLYLADPAKVIYCLAQANAQNESLIQEDD
jgi:hypothetical protein